MARVQWKWRGSNENGAGNKFRDQLPGIYIQDGGYFD
jgi:hypothetical protein